MDAESLTGARGCVWCANVNYVGRTSLRVRRYGVRPLLVLEPKRLRRQYSSFSVRSELHWKPSHLATGDILTTITYRRRVWSIEKRWHFTQWRSRLVVVASSWIECPLTSCPAWLTSGRYWLTIGQWSLSLGWLTMATVSGWHWMKCRSSSSIHASPRFPRDTRRPVATSASNRLYWADPPRYSRQF